MATQKSETNWVKWVVIFVLGLVVVFFVLPMVVMMVFAGALFSIFETIIEKSSAAPEIVGPLMSLVA